jgi:predicted dehydrogenase
MTSVGVALLGAGPWGRTLARVLTATPGAELRWICEPDERRRAEAGQAHPAARVTASLSDVLEDPGVAAVAVAVNPPRHAELGLRVLEANRHLYVEKPLALSAGDAAAVVAAASERGRVLLVGHQLLHHPAVRRARQVIGSGVMGELLHFKSARETVGPPRSAGSCWWTLAPHDVSLAIDLLGAVPVAVSATAGGFISDEHDSAASASLRFADGRVAHVHVARFAATGTRQLTVAGRAATLTFDELAGEGALRILESGQATPKAIPFDGIDPLSAHCRHFVSCVGRGAPAEGNGEHALAVVRVLEAGARSMRAGGAPVELPCAPAELP